VFLPGYAPLPRPSIAGPIGGALLPTEQGFAAPKAAGVWQHNWRIVWHLCMLLLQPLPRYPVQLCLCLLYQNQLQLPQSTAVQNSAFGAAHSRFNTPLPANNVLPSPAAALFRAETEIGHGSSREGATSSLTLGTLQGGLQPGYTADVAESPRKSGEAQRATVHPNNVPHRFCGGVGIGQPYVLSIVCTSQYCSTAPFCFAQQE
jgi:hypothetical protein